MKLTHSQISEILSNYTSSSEGFVTLQCMKSGQGCLPFIIEGLATV